MTKARDVASNGGLVLITKQDFSTASTVSVNNCFSSEYDNYRIIFDMTGFSNSSTINFRLRNSSTDRTDSSYSSGNNITGTSGQDLSYGTAGASYSIINRSYVATGTQTYFKSVFDIWKPYSSSNSTVITGNLATISSGGSLGGGTIWNLYSATNQNDGFTFYPEVGTFTGIVSVYGYKN